jgi:hypothetical protein|tara:strand:+ start:950 stop:1423 length:474 start_codon:yes stop_codon:yes gene_type:complete
MLNRAAQDRAFYKRNTKKKKRKGLEYPKTKGPYKIKKGDTLSELARDNNTTVAKLMELNPDIKDKDKIRAGAGLKGINEKKEVYSRKYSPDPKGEEKKKVVKKKPTTIKKSKLSRIMSAAYPNVFFSEGGFVEKRMNTKSKGKGAGAAVKGMGAVVK